MAKAEPKTEVEFSARAVGHLLLIRPDPIKKQQGRIQIVVDERLERNAGTTGTVLDVGPEAFRAFGLAAGFEHPRPWVAPGQRIYFVKYAGKWIDDAKTGEPLLFIRDEDVIGLV